jgi:hypothetical protein
MTIWRLNELPGEATMRLRSGDRVRVNGTLGTVEPLEA